jgi:hypothetical protein
MENETPYLTIEVTAADIIAGYRESCSNCPIAKAIKRTTGKHVVRVTSDAIAIAGKDYRGTTLECRLKIGRFIKDFDNGFEVHPMSIELELAQ